jgi:hypothetical protein
VNPKEFFGELKRRNVYRVAAAYAVIAWLFIQIATQVFLFFEIPNRAVRHAVLFLIIGFPVPVILACAFELTPEGIERTEEVATHESIRHRTGRRIVAITMALAVIAAGLLALQLSRQRPSRSAASPVLAKAPSIDVAPGVKDQALARLETYARDGTDFETNFINFNLYLDPLRGDPSFEMFVQKVAGEKS